MKFTCRSEATRQFIIEKASTLFNMKGFAATSLSDLSKVTQLTKGSIYGNFKNKEDVAMAVFEYNLSRKTNAIKQKVQEAGSYRDKLLAFAYSFADVDHTNSTAGGCPLLNAGIEADDTNVDLRKKVADGLLHWRNEMVRIIRGGIAAHEFREDTDPDHIAVSMIALMEGSVFMYGVTKDPEYPGIIAQTIRNLVGSIGYRK